MSRSLLAFSLAVVGACGEALALLGGTLDLEDAVIATANLVELIALRIVAEYLGRPDVAKRVHAQFGRVTRADDAGTHSPTAQAASWSARCSPTRQIISPRASKRRARRKRPGRTGRRWASSGPFLCTSCGTRWTSSRALGGGPGRPPAPRNNWARKSHTTRRSRSAYWRASKGARARRGGTCGRGCRRARRRGRGPHSLESIHLGGLLALDAGDLAEACAWAEASDRWLAWSGTGRCRAEGEALLGAVLSPSR